MLQSASTCCTETSSSVGGDCVSSVCTLSRLLYLAINYDHEHSSIHSRTTCVAHWKSSVPSKRSLEARRMRSRRKKTKARVKAWRPPYLVPGPCDSVVHEDCVAIDCEMIVVRSRDPAERTALASVAIVNKDLKCVYEKFLQPPPHHRINQESRKYCPVTDRQLAIAGHCPCTSSAISVD